MGSMTCLVTGGAGYIGAHIVASLQGHGYTAVGELKDHIIDGASEILMHKRLRRT